MEAARTFVLCVLCILALGVLLSPSAKPTTLAPLSLAQLTSSAAAIVRAECLGSHALWRGGEIWTVTSFRVIESWKGNSPGEIDVWMIGGRAGAITSFIPGAPRFRSGEEVILFLEPVHSRALPGALSITAWGEGTFRIFRDACSGSLRVTQDTAIVPEFDASSRAFRAAGIRDWPLGRLKAHVLAAENSARRPQ